MPEPKRLDPLIIPDGRTDANGAVAIAFTPAELEAFVGLLNRGTIVIEDPLEDGAGQIPGPAYLLHFLPRYFGRGIAAIEITKTAVDRCQGGYVCPDHPWLPPDHNGCDAGRVPCEAPRHTMETARED